MTAEAGRVHAAFEGEPIEAEAGASVAAALIASDRVAWRTTREGRSRGLFCGIGVCFDCLVEIDGESGQRACMIPLAEGMDVRRAPLVERTSARDARSATPEGAEAEDPEADEPALPNPSPSSGSGIAEAEADPDSDPEGAAE